MPQPERSKIEELEKEINRQLKRPQRDWLEIASNLKKLRRLKPAGELAAEQDRLETRYQSLLAAHRDALTGQIETALETFRKSLDKGELPKEDLAGQIRSAMKELVGLELAEDKVPEWKGALDKLRREESDWAKVLQVKQEVESLWARAERGEQEIGSPGSISSGSILEYFKQALTKVEGQMRAHYVRAADAKRRLENLETEAKTRLREASNRYEIILTGAAGEEVVTQLKIFLKMEKDNPKTLVSYSASAEPKDAAVPQVQEVGRAVRVAQDFVLQFWHRKVIEYTDNAREMLENQHNPRAAWRILEKCQELPGLNDPVIGLQLSVGTQNLITNLQGPVAQAVQARQETESLCQRALDENDLSKAVELLKNVPDQYTPALQDTRATIRGRILEQSRVSTEAAEAWFEEGAWRNAENGVTRARDLLSLDPELKGNELTSRAEKVDAALRDVHQTKQEIAAATDPHIAQEILAPFIKRYTTERVEKWEDMRRLRDGLKVQAEAYEFLTTFQASIGPGATKERLEDALDDYQEWKDKIPRQYQARFEGAKNELDARLGYMRALELKGTDLDGALKALAPALSPGLEKTHPDLVQAAKDLQNELAPVNEEEARRAIQDIRETIPRSPGDAFKEAVEWKAKPTFQKAVFVELENEARSVWEQRVTTRIDNLLRDSLTPSVIKQIRKGLADLQAMHSELETTYRARAELPCAIAEAEAAEKLAEKATPHNQVRLWSEAVEAWGKAYDEALTYPDTATELEAQPEDYEERRLLALKQQRRAQARKASPSEKIELFAELNDALDESDPEVWLWLGNAHLDSAEELARAEESESPVPPSGEIGGIPHAPVPATGAPGASL